MAFPTSIPSNTDPTSNNKLPGPSHSQLHQSHNAEIVAIETKIGTGASTPSSGKVLRANGTGTSAWAQIDLSTDVATLSSATLRSLLTDETGTGVAVFGTSPTIATPSITTSINDVSGNEVIRTPATASAVNDITITNAATGNSPTITASGDDTNINLTLTAKGAGQTIINGRYDAWVTGLAAPTAVVCNGNRSYTQTFSSVNYSTILSAGMRLRTTRTVAAPTQCTSLNGSTQFYSKSSPAGMTFTDDFVVSVYVKLSSYTSNPIIISRYNGTSGWWLYVDGTGRVGLVGYNAGAANFSQVQSNQSIPLNKWVHVASQLDMSTFTATTTTSYVMIDGVDVPATVARGGTNPTALVQAGNLEIGSQNGGSGPFPGKIAQAAVFNAKVTQATMRGYISQGLAGTETSLISAYSFNNSVTDLNTSNANNLTANGSAVATNADSPFGGQADGTISSTLDYGIIQSVTFSTNTTVVLQVPEGCTIPTSGGVSAVVYSSSKVPYGFPGNREKWSVDMLNKTDAAQGSPTNGIWYNPALQQLNIPVGAWSLSYQAGIYSFVASGTGCEVRASLSTSNNAESDPELSTPIYISGASGAVGSIISLYRNKGITLSSSTIYYLVASARQTSTATVDFRGDLAATIIRAENAYL